MPEYLAPGVYVEEVDTGSKPIEGVSTSTAGMLGVTERGPVNVPILVTSYGEYQRWFGQYLRPEEYSNGNDPHCYLPHAVEGFFVNGGRRAYITRVLDVAGAVPAFFQLHNRGDGNSAASWLLRPAQELTGVAGSEIYLLNVNAAIPGTGTLANGDRVRIGAGSDAEYRDVAAAPGAANHLPLNFPLLRAHSSANNVLDLARTLAAAPNQFNLAADARAGDTTLQLVAAAGDVVANDLLEVGVDWGAELRFVTGAAVDPISGNLVVTLADPLQVAHAAGANQVAKLNYGFNLGDPQFIDENTTTADTRAGESVVFLTPPMANFTDHSQIVVFDRGDPALREARRIGDLGVLFLAVGAYWAYAPGTTVQRVTLGDNGAARTLTAPAAAGSTVIAVSNRVGLAAGSVIRVAAGAGEEFAVVMGVPNRSPGLAAPDAGNLILGQPLAGSYATAGTQVFGQNAPAIANDRPASVLPVSILRGGAALPVTDAGNGGSLYQANEIVRVVSAAGDVAYHRLTQNAVDLDARPVALNAPLSMSHPAGSATAERQEMLRVQAVDAGRWGNRLRVSVEDEPAGLVSTTTLAAVLAANSIRLGSPAGVEAGTVLELVLPDGRTSGDLLKVQNLNRATGVITLDAALSAQQQADFAGLPAGAAMGVRSREFRLTVRLLRQPDPANPTRNATVLDLETFRHLSMDPRHSRYVHRIVGTTWDMTLTPAPPADHDGTPLRLADRRSEGESWYVRVRDTAWALAEPARTTRLQSVRLGPETLVDILPDGRVQPARHPLNGGDDSIGTLTDAIYTGNDDVEPLNRTGLHSLRNEEDISIVAVPGRTGATMQGNLIAHCELIRYRFAVLDGPPPPRDSLNDVQTQRQQFDTKYAAMYHPWLRILHPFPPSPASIPEYAIPPSGHMLGVYARTDIERGVHKAPANEVVRGIVRLQGVLRKEQQDILNPSPVNVNVIRDFRSDNRGIRVYGARVITSDPDYKYVNVRRLLIFLEASIDRGLQWVVFEPNADPLWARVRRSISSFLTTVWRNGALEGATREEAFFVKCDRTTMTQTDIDNGRLIVVVGVAPVKPAEYVIVRIGLWTAHAEE